MTDLRRHIERKLERLELRSAASMREAVEAYFARVPSGTRSAPRWSPGVYPTGSEKELYAEFSYALLARPEEMLTALLEAFETPTALELARASAPGVWRIFRISTARPAPRNRYRGPRIFCGGAGYGAIADIGLFLNASLHPESDPCLRADRILYFELKSNDGAVHDRSQLEKHLTSLAAETCSGVAFLGAIGGRSISMNDLARWLGHVSFTVLLPRLALVAAQVHGLAHLSDELHDLRRRRGADISTHVPNPPLQPTGFAGG